MCNFGTYWGQGGVGEPCELRGFRGACGEELTILGEKDGEGVVVGGGAAMGDIVICGAGRSLS